MYTEQLHAGFALGATFNALSGDSHAADMNALRQLCTFQLEVDSEPEPVDNSIFAVADNLLSRGLPTLPTCDIERAMAKSLGSTAEDTDNMIELRFPFVRPLMDTDIDCIRRTLAIVDPRVATRLANGTPTFGSKEEEEFLHQALPSMLGTWAVQLVEQQRRVETIIPDQAAQFVNQQVDFSVELPYVNRELAGLVVEIDGSQHLQPVQAALDGQRDSALARKKWSTVRIPANQSKAPAPVAVQQIDDFFSQPYCSRIKQNYEAPLYKELTGREWMQLILSPLMIARLQKTLIRLVLNGQLDVTAETWRVAVVERDLPGAHLAVNDFRTLIMTLLALEGRNRDMPSIELRVFRTAEFDEFEIAKEYPSQQYDDMELV